jgi:hypothetical protein
VAGFNFARAGQRRYLSPCVVAGSVLSVAVAWPVMLVPGTAGKRVCPLANLAVGLAFMPVQ